MTTEAKISIVTPAYNEVDRIEKYFKALLGQTVLPYEIIVVDGGSTDGTIDVINHFSKMDSRIRLLKGSHEGPAKDRNIGWKASKGTHILFLDADVQIDKNFIEMIKKSVEGKRTDKKLVIYHSVVSSWSEIAKKYMWYGRTMPRYWMKNKKDFEILIRMSASLGIVLLPFLLFIKIFSFLFFLNFLLIFLVGLKNAIGTWKVSNDFSFFLPVLIFVFISFIFTGIGMFSIPILKLIGRYSVGR